MKKKLLAISLTTMSCLYGMLSLVIILAFALTGLPISTGILISLIIIIVQFLIAPAVNDLVFRLFYKMKPDYELPEYLKEFINETCKKHNMKYPKIGFIDDGSPNAFTYGRTKNDARVVITRGILELLNEDEVKAVVAHELGHAIHYDMLFMTVAQVVPLVLYYVSDILLNNSGKSSSSSSNNNNSYGAAVGLVAYILYIVSEYIILWLSRTREYYADSFAVEEVKSPTALANALVKIGFGLSIGGKEKNSKVSKGNALGISNAKVSKGMAIGAYNNGEVSRQSIVNAMKWEKWNVWANLYELNSTHPLISNRLLAISERCEEFGEYRYITFDEKKPESYVDDFIVELLLSMAPVIIFLGAFIAGMVTFANDGNGLMIFAIGGVLFTISLFILLNRTHKNSNYKETSVAELLGEVKVSNVTSIPCVLHGTIIGRGNPGCIFNEDFVLKDSSGIIFLDYNQPIHIAEKIFAIFKSEEYFNKTVKVKGWYRRALVPYVEVYSIEIDGKVKKCHTYTVNKVINAILLILSIVGIVYSSGLL